MGRLGRQKQELLCVFFVAFAFLHKHNEFDERVLVDVVIALDYQVPHNFAQSRRVLLVNTDIDDLVEQLLSHALNLLIFLYVFHDLFEMLLLWPHGQSLKKVLVNQRMHFHLLIREDISGKKILRLFPLLFSRERREEYLVDHQLNIWDELIKLVSLINH